MAEETGFQLEKVIHIHSTQVIDPVSHLSLTMTAIPISALGVDRGDLQGIAQALDLEILSLAPEPVVSFLPHAILSASIADTPREAATLFDQMMNDPPIVTGREFSPAQLRFVQHCAFDQILGIEESPLRAKILAGIVGVAGTIAVAAMATVVGPVLLVIGVGVGTAAETVIILSTAVAVSERIYAKMAGDNH
jgi:hypothetical protein